MGGKHAQSYQPSNITFSNHSLPLDNIGQV